MLKPLRTGNFKVFVPLVRQLMTDLEPYTYLGRREAEREKTAAQLLV
jgi:hypothetical protein